MECVLVDGGRNQEGRGQHIVCIYVGNIHVVIALARQWRLGMRQEA